MPLPQITITGNVVDDPELRYTGTGKAVANFRVAANKPKKVDGAWTDGESCFLTVNVWEALAEQVAEAVERGAKVVVTGELRQREYEARDGTQRTVYEVTAKDVALALKRPAQRQKPQESAGDPWQTTPPDDPWAVNTRTDEPPF